MQQQRPHGLADWHCSQGTQLDKQNGKLLYPGIRLINMPDPLGKHFFRHLWQKGVPTSAGAARDYAAGYAKHRSREEAILHQLCLGHRLHKAKVGCATFLKDVANSFYGPEHVHLDAAVGHATRPCDKQLLKQRHRAASIHIQAADGEVFVAAGSGALQGDSIGQICSWNSTTLWLTTGLQTWTPWIQRGTSCLHTTLSTRSASTPLSPHMQRTWLLRFWQPLRMACKRKQWLLTC